MGIGVASMGAKMLRASGAPLAALKGNGPIKRILLARLLQDLATALALVAMTVQTFGVGGAALVGVGFTLRYAASAVVAPVLTIRMERVQPGRALMTGHAASAVGLLIAFCGALLGGAGVWASIAGVVIMTIGDMVARASRFGFLPVLATSAREVAAANAVSGTSGAVALLVGPALGTVALLGGGPATAFAVGSACAVAGAATAWRDHRAAEIALPEAGSATHVLRAQARTVRATVVSAAFGLIVAQTVVSGALQVFYAPLAEAVLPDGEAGVGLLQTAFGAGAVLVGFGLFAFAGRNRLGLLSGVMTAVLSVPLMVVGFLLGPTAAIVGVAVMGGGIAIFDVVIVTWLQRALPDSLRPRVFGIVETVVVVAKTIGAAIATPLLTAFGLEGALAVVGGLGLVALVATAPTLIRLDRELVAPAANVALLRRNPLFALLPTPSIDLLAVRLRTISLRTGEIVVTQGSVGKQYYLIGEGSLGVSVDGREIGTMTPPDGFGEIALLRDTPRTATVTAREPSTIHAISGNLFRDAVGSGGGSLATAVADVRLRRAAPRDLKPVDGE